MCLEELKAFTIVHVRQRTISAMGFLFIQLPVSLPMAAILQNGSLDRIVFFFWWWWWSGMLMIIFAIPWNCEHIAVAVLDQGMSPTWCLFVQFMTISPWQRVLCSESHVVLATFQSQSTDKHQIHTLISRLFNSN